MNSVAEATAGSKHKLIEVTIDLMSSRGFGAMGIQSILEAADVTKSNFYYHFKSKEDLCLAALDTMINYFFSQYLDPVLLDKSLSPKRRLEKLFSQMYNKAKSGQCQRGCPFVNLAAETSDFLPAFREKIDWFFTQYRKKLAECYREGVEKGEFRSDIDPNLAALNLLISINGTSVVAKAQKKPQIIKQNAETILALISTTR